MRSLLRRVAFWVPLAVSLVSLPLVLAAQDWDWTKRIFYQVPGMERAEVKKEIVYKRDGAQEVKMDIYCPPGLAKDERRPAVIFIHGGYLPRGITFWPKDWGIYVSYGQLMAASGLVGVTFNHRYHGWDEKSLETSFADVQDAIRHVRDHACEYHIDPERICLWAFSGGGPHLSIALRQKMEYVRCLVSFYGILDLGTDTSAETSAKYSPVTYLNDKNEFLPPVLIARAGLDSPDINRSIGLFVSRAMVLNGDINLLSHPLGRHGFDILDDNERTREIIAATVTFIQNHLNRETYPDSRFARIAGEIKVSLAEGKIAKAREEVRSLPVDPARRSLLENLTSEASLNNAGYSLLRTDPRAALAAFQWALELYPASPNAMDGLADAYEATGQIELALANVQKALALLDKTPGLSDSRKKTIRDSLAAKLKRLKKQQEDP